MDVEKVKNRVTNTYDIFLKENNKIFRMSYQGNLDIYWSIRAPEYDSIDQEYGYYNLSITKANYLLYEAFATLYDDIVKAQLVDVEDLNNFSSLTEYQKYLAKRKKWQEQELASAAYQSLVSEDVITWLSDDAILNENGDIDSLFPPAFVTIRKQLDAILLEFKVRLIKGVKNQPVIIRFRSSGSAYGHFYIPFMLMHLKLQDYDCCNQQIHLEEYLYLTRRKEKEK